MRDVVTAGALLCVVLGLVAAGAVLLRTRSLRQALPVLLEFLMAAGLLRLSADTSWQVIATAAVVVALRRLVVSVGLRQAQRSAA